jgi:hypothetical protein
VRRENEQVDMDTLTEKVKRTTYLYRPYQTMQDEVEGFRGAG